MVATTTKPSKKGDNDFMEGVTNLLSYFQGMIIDEWSEIRQDIFGNDDECDNGESEFTYPIVEASVCDVDDDDDEETLSTMSASRRNSCESYYRESRDAESFNPPIPSLICFREQNLPAVDNMEAGGRLRSFSKHFRHKRVFPSKWSKRNGYKSKTWTNKFAVRLQQQHSTVMGEETGILFDTMRNVRGRMLRPNCHIPTTEHLGHRGP